MRVFLFCVFVVAVLAMELAAVLYMAGIPGEDNRRGDQLDRIEEKLDTLIEIGESWQ